jgi:sugar lactone lactonase YvrE
MELIFYAGSSLLEGPIWDINNRLVYCVSIEQGIIYQINPFSGEVRSYLTRGSVGCISLMENGNLMSAEKEGIFEINPKTGERIYLTQFESDINLRYNDGKFDPVGRFIVGTKSEKDYFVEKDVVKGKLFSYYNGVHKVLLNNLLISNGIGFSPNNEKMYFIDSPTKKVNQYKYDLNTGYIEFEKYIINIDGNGIPDGMCVDLDGNIWVAEWEGGRVRKWDINTGNVLDEVILPCSRVTSCCLGGKDMDELFITTAKSEKDILGGALFRKKINRI